MIDRIITFSIRNRALVIVAGFVLALWGLYAVYHTPVDAIPDLSETQVIVFSDWLGHSPREIEDQVTYPVSSKLQGLAGARVVRSSSEFNFSMISVIFDDGVDIHSARQQVAERLGEAGKAGVALSLPDGVVPYLAPDAPATGQVFWYTVEGAGQDLGRLRAIQDSYVRPQLASIPGVAELASVGGHPIEYQIEVDPERLRDQGVVLGNILHAVAQTNSAVGGHVIHKGQSEYIVRGVGWIGYRSTNGAFTPAQAVRDLEAVPIPCSPHAPREASHPSSTGATVPLRDLARVSVGTQFRRGVLEKDGNEVTGGVVLMRYGENPLELTRRIKNKIQELQVGLPAGVRIVPFYDRIGLIEGAVHTVTATLFEAIATATICVLLVLAHLRTSFIIAVTLPLATLASFATMWTLRRLGIAEIQTNIMSLAGIAISIGVLVDASIVMAENAMHHLKNHFGDKPVRGDIRELVLPACLLVGRPIFFSVLIMLLSFLPVFALGGIAGRMFRPLAFTKSFALLAAALLAITLVPALCTIFIKGRLRRETDSWLVRGVIEVYRPVLDYCLRNPAILAWIISITFIVGFAPLGSRALFLAILGLAIFITGSLTRAWPQRAVAIATLILIALIANQNMQPLGWTVMTPLDEGMVMDMPITIPRASIIQSADDLKARDMVFCRFPEVDMVVGKAGRAETPTDPAPLNMIETMINFRPPEFWPKRKLSPEDARGQALKILHELTRKGWIESPPDAPAEEALLEEMLKATMPLFDAQMREYAYQRNQEFLRELGKKLARTAIESMVSVLEANSFLDRPVDSSGITLLSESVLADIAARMAQDPSLEDVTALAQSTAQKITGLGWARPDADLLRYRPNRVVAAVVAVHTALGGASPTFYSSLQADVLARHRTLWREHIDKVNDELPRRATETYIRLVLEDILTRCRIRNDRIARAIAGVRRAREQLAGSKSAGAGHHHGSGASAPPVVIEPQPELNSIQDSLTTDFMGHILLWRKDRSDLIGFGGELDRVMQMPGWTNVWTMPIQNRVDMLATGVNTTVGVRVLGRKLEDVVRASEDIATFLRTIPGAADVVADPIRNKGYLEIHIDRDKAARYGLNVGDINSVIETALGGNLVTTIVDGRERYPLRVRFPRAWRDSEEAVRNLPIPVRASHASRGNNRDQSTPPASPLTTHRSPLTIPSDDGTHIPLSEVADIRIAEGPASIKSENGLLRNYVYLNVHGRNVVDFVEEARHRVAGAVPLPPGVFLEWTGQFEQEVRAWHTILLLGPLVVGLIFLILYFTYHDLADALLMLLAVPGALAGGVLFQWLFGYKFSITVMVGYVACFGMATATGIIMLVYLREAVAKAGGLEHMSLDRLKQAVMDGAVHRLRPKLLTEATVVIGLAPMLWATGTGAEVIKPMAAPVLGGILIADEVIDLLLPVLFYWVRRWRWERLQRLEARPDGV
jgi:Cu(I)/Ag(I) efflux system membrane protein CusA/SilA